VAIGGTNKAESLKEKQAIIAAILLRNLLKPYFK
jgi:hypothetical protein